MKIGIDLRFLKQWDYYSKFILELVKNIIKEKKLDNFIIFVNILYSQTNFWENTKNIIVNTWNFFDEQIKFNKILQKEKLDNAIFFWYNKPIKYKCNYIIFIPDLEEFHFTPKKNIFKKYFDNYLLSENSKNANKIICFNENIKNEINDKLNIFEDNIKIITPFFNIKQVESKDINIDIRTKYNIKDNYFIYYFWEWESKNLDRLIEVFDFFKKENINKSLVILDKFTVSDVSLRKKVIQKNLNDKIFFIWDVSESEKTLFFKHSLWVIYPVLYTVFPFMFSNAINYNSQIFSSNLENIKNIFWNKIIYFNQTDTKDIYNKIQKNQQNNIDYTNIIKEYNIQKTTEMLNNIIK